MNFSLFFSNPNSLIGNNIGHIRRELGLEKNKEKFIGLFVMKVLPYKDKIDEGNYNFFMNKSYNDDLDGDNNLMDKVFEMKGIWSQLSKENRDIVILYMQALCGLAEKYFIIKYGV
jgi:hypothetical protein